MRSQISHENKGLISWKIMSFRLVIFFSRAIPNWASASNQTLKLKILEKYETGHFPETPYCLVNILHKVKFSFFPVLCFVNTQYYYFSLSSPDTHFSHWQKKRGLFKPFVLGENTHSGVFHLKFV